MKTVDLFLLENTQVKSRSYKCYAVAKCGVVKEEHIVFPGIKGDPHRVISVARGVPMDVVDMIRVKNTVHTISRIATVVTTDIIDE